MSERRAIPRVARSRGFSLIEVLVALLVLSLGLLGLAFLQVLNVRYTQSANHRTVATNLAYEALDLMRSNHAMRARFATVTKASFAGVQPSASGCSRNQGAGAALPDANIERWRCEVVSGLPNGVAEISFNGPEANVLIEWTDNVAGDDADTSNRKSTVFQVRSRL